MRYAAGMGWVLGTGVPNVDAFIASDIPTGSGLSSSAAVEMAFGNLFRLLSHAKIEDLDLALLGQLCENQFVGVPCGMMDQIAVQMGRSGQAMLIDTMQPPWVEYASLPFGVKMVVCNTGIQHQLGDSGYPLRRRQSEDAAMILGVGTLRECSVAELMERQDDLPEVLFRRAKHCVTEIERTLQFYDALKNGETDKLGPLMAASHTSLRDDYDVSCPELDKMAEIAQKAPGCLGARMTGGGFGGACIALVHEKQTEEFIEVCRREYGSQGNFFECKPVDGACVIELN
ncbi:MAG: galactokinase [Armatimonadetes bacterium]|nr:galactokinase [Armatimonadota bacterium]